MQQQRVLRTPAAAAYLALGAPTLEKLRVKGGGPKFIRLGTRAVGYDVRDLDAWIEGQKRTSTSDASEALIRRARVAEAELRSGPERKSTGVRASA